MNVLFGKASVIVTVGNDRHTCSYAEFWHYIKSVQMPFFLFKVEALYDFNIARIKRNGFRIEDSENLYYDQYADRTFRTNDMTLVAK